ncbi:Hsp70 family protein [Dactylosporangium sp. CA-092794]|uniref:Hsp70 family protein n=1 Tax=Dactylosporangium sp. CA-092794 TaxID=3239929 RepID=UPI003D8FEA18
MGPTPTHRLAIDLGTCHTVAVVHRGDEAPRALLFDGSPVMPSGIYADEHGRLTVGRDAERLSQLAPERFEPFPKRSIDEGAVLLGQVEVTVVEMLASLLRRAAEESLQAGVNPVGSTVLTCPADWGGQRRGVLLEAARAANLGPVVLVDEPIAAATYCLRVLGQQVAPLQSLAVFDFGGGTLDVSVVRREFDGLRVLGVGGLDDLGGVDIDAALVGHLGQLINLRYPELWQRLSNPDSTAAHRDRRELWTEVRAAKEMLSRAASAPVHLPGTDEALHLTREELERVAGPLVDRAVDETRRVLERAGVDVRQLAGLFLVGGSSRIPLVASRLHARFGVAPVVPEQPELPVAYGGMLAVGTTPQQQFDAPPVPRPRPVSGTPAVPGQSPAFQQPAGIPVSNTWPSSSIPTSPGAYGSPAAFTSQAFPAAPASPATAPGAPITPPGGQPPFNPQRPMSPPGAPAGPAGPGVIPPPAPPGIGPMPPGAMPPGTMPPGAPPSYGPPVVVRPRRRVGPWIALVIVLAIIGSCVWGGNKIFTWFGNQVDSARNSIPGLGGTDGPGKVDGLKAGTPIQLSSDGAASAVAGAGSIYTAQVSTGSTVVTAYETAGGQSWTAQVQMEPAKLQMSVVGNLLIIDGEDDAKLGGDGKQDSRTVIDVGTHQVKWTKAWDSSRIDMMYLGTDAIVEVRDWDKPKVERVNLADGAVKWTSNGDPGATYSAGERGARPSVHWPGGNAPADVRVPSYGLDFSGLRPFQESLWADTGKAVQMISDTKAQTIDLNTGKATASGTVAKDSSSDSWLVYNDLAMFKPQNESSVVAYRISDWGKAWEYKANSGTTVDDLRPCGEKLVCVAGKQNSAKDLFIGIDTTNGQAKWSNTVTRDRKGVITGTEQPNWYVMGNGKLVGGHGVFDSVEDAAILDPATGHDQTILGEGLAAQNVYAGYGNNVVIESVKPGTGQFAVYVVSLDGKILGSADIRTVLQDLSISGDSLVVLDTEQSKVYRYSIPDSK